MIYTQLKNFQSRILNAPISRTLPHNILTSIFNHMIYTKKEIE